MLCPEGAQNQNETILKDDEKREKMNVVPADGNGSLELASYKNPKTWKKSITNFFRNQLRSTKSNEGDHPSGSTEKFDDKDVSPEQKWQSLGKIFRRQSFAEHWDKSTNQGECSSHKRFGVKKAISSYFGKNQKSLSETQAQEN